MMRRPHRQEGFTLVELTVALAAGLIVALGIVGMSKEATHTFHEEMRSSAAEGNLRSAMDRLRADLARAGYMSTGNVSTDPMIAKLPGGPANPYAALLGLGHLTSIWLDYGHSAAATPLSAVQAIPMNPDAIDIAGNMTSTDQYEVSTIQTGASACGGDRIFLDMLSSSFLRIFAGGGTTELNNIFQPVGASAGQFIVRFVDKTTHSQFLATCAGSKAIDTQGTQVFLDVAGSVQTALATGNVSGVSGYCTGCLVNPVQIVHWEIEPATAEPALYLASPLGGQPLTPNVTDPTKYDLVRWYVDAVSGAAIPGTTEVVAEYAVDLKFAFTVDQGPNALQPQIVTFPLDNANSALWAPNILKTATPGPPDPARIRSVSVRLATRSAEPDRTLDVPVPNNAPPQPYVYRYCVLPGGCNANNPTGILQFARARTLTAEVAIPNQSRNYY